jgi:L-rhamnose mutarotase
VNALGNGRQDGDVAQATPSSAPHRGPAATRRCFLLHVRPERLAEYVADHERVWPAMLAALTRTGWRNYSLFVRPEDGLVVGYFESDDADAAISRMALEDVDRRWQESMAPYFVPGTGLQQLVPYFHLP